MKSFNPNSFLSESLTHARKMEVGISEGRGLVGVGDGGRGISKRRSIKGRLEGGGGGGRGGVEKSF
jgi:hypothetical protein